MSPAASSGPTDHAPAGGWQVSDQLTATITRHIGQNIGAAIFVTESTGEAVPEVFYSAGFIGPDDATFTGLLFRDSRRPNAAVLVIHDGGLRLCRGILETLADAAFQGAAVDEIVTQAGPADLARRSALTRLGFTYAGREVRRDGERVLYALRAEAIPEPYRRARARRQH